MKAGRQPSELREGLMENLAYSWYRHGGKTILIEDSRSDRLENSNLILC